MPKTKYPTTEEIEAKDVSRQRRLQLRANHAGLCASCLKNSVSEYYPKSGRCEPCRLKNLVCKRKINKCQKPQPYRMRPRCDEILAVVKSTPLDQLKDKKQLAELAKELKCPAGYIDYLRRQKLGVKFNRGRPKK